MANDSNQATSYVRDTTYYVALARVVLVESANKATAAGERREPASLRGLLCCFQHRRFGQFDFFMKKEKKRERRRRRAKRENYYVPGTSRIEKPATGPPSG